LKKSDDSSKAISQIFRYAGFPFLRVSASPRPRVASGESHTLPTNGSPFLRFPVSPFPFTLTALLFLTIAAAAQTTEPNDTLLYRLNGGIEIIGTRLLGGNASSSPVESISADEIRAAPVATLADLARGATGATVQSYGCAGSLQLVSMRGLGPEYTVVYRNGVRLNNAQNGLADVGRIHLANVERIEIARGGFTPLYGSDALGGVISVRTGRPSSPLSAEVGFGSNGRKAAGGSISHSGGLGFVAVHGMYEEADNGFSFEPRYVAGEAPMTRANADYIRRGLSMDGRVVGSGIVIDASGELRGSDAGAPGAVLQAEQGRARQRDLDATLAVSCRTALSSSAVLSVTPAMVSSDQRYDDPGIIMDGAPLASRYRNTSLSIGVAVEKRFSENALIAMGMDLSRASLLSNEVNSSPLRLSASFFSSSEISLHAGGMPIILHPSARIEAMDDSPDGRRLLVFSPAIGIHAAIVPELLAVRGRVAQGFRAPTFNQLYWREGGNPSLKAEYAIAADAGIRVTPGSLLRSIDASVFLNDMKDRIVWMPVSSVYWTPRNIQKVRTMGVELIAATSPIPDRLRAELGAQWTSSKKMNASFAGDATQGKQLIYVPDVCFSLNAEWLPFDGIAISSRNRFVGRRYSSETNDPSSRLPEYFTSDIAASFALPLGGMKWILKAEILNLFDSSYEVIEYYPMPGRTFRLAIAAELR
jgi:vitamin B12 transporter